MTDDVLALLRDARITSDDEVRDAWNRSLPFADALFDRWERAERLGFGSGTSVYDSSAIYGEVVVGQETWIGPNTLLDGSGGGLTIGDFCNISAGVHIYTHDSSLRCVSLGAIDVVKASVEIGSGTYIGSQSIVAAGTTVGERCIVGANSFVNADIADRTVVAGNPARPIGRVVGEGTDTRIERCLDRDTFGEHDA